jgi:hypothetical protein
VRFRFLQRPEYITPGTRFVFREGRTKVRGGGGAADAVLHGWCLACISQLKCCRGRTAGHCRSTHYSAPLLSNMLSSPGLCLCCCCGGMQGIGVVVASEKPTMSSSTPNGSLAVPAAGGSCSAAAATAHVEPLRKDQPAGR